MAQAITEAPLREIRDLRGPPGWPLIGSLASVDASRMHEQLERWVGQFGPMYRVALGPHSMVVVSRPELVVSVLRGRPDAWRRIDKLRDVLREAGVHGLFSAEGGEWRRQRRLVMEAFDPGHLKRYFESLALTTGRLLRRFEQAARCDEPIELQPTLMRYTVDVTTGLAFGADLNTLEQPGHALQRHLNTIFPMLMRRLNAPLPYWRFVKLPADRAFDRQLAVVHAAVRAFVRDARARVEREPQLREQPQNLLQAMVAARDDSGAALSEEELLGNVLTVLLAGQDTTANTMCWMLHHLHADRRAWAEVVAECDAALAPAPLAAGFEITRGLDAVERCASETMRLRPVAPFLFLQNNVPTVLGDVRLPADSSVICLMRHAAIDERLSADAREFQPARWRDDGAGAGVAAEAQRELLRASMPFGAGPRLCPGRYLALLEIKMVISMLARNFELVDVATEHGAAPRERLEFTMCPERLTMQLRPRAQPAPQLS
jgi:cytochrome P450